MRYLLIEHTDDGPRKARVTEYSTAEERDTASCIAMEGDDWNGSLADADELLASLRDDGWARFEGDPPLQWVDAI